MLKNRLVKMSNFLSNKKNERKSIVVIELKDNIFSKMVHPSLLLAEDLIYKPSELVLENLKIEDESADYGAAEFTINNHSIKFRVGKITPTKIGQFVTFWKRIGKGPILPYDLNDPFDFLIISSSAENHFVNLFFQKLCSAKKASSRQAKKKVKELCAFIRLGIKQIIPRLRKHKLGSYNISLNSPSMTLILHA